MKRGDRIRKSFKDAANPMITNTDEIIDKHTRASLCFIDKIRCDDVKNSYVLYKFLCL
jgi:hypothetical protein